MAEHEETYEDLGLDDEMPFGKYTGVPIRYILAEDKQYLIWAASELENLSFDNEVNCALESEGYCMEVTRDECFD